MGSTTRLTLWMFTYHIGESSATNYSVPMFLYFLYAEDEQEARAKLEKVKPKLLEDLIKSGWSGELWEEAFTPEPHGFNTGKRFFEGKVEVDADGKPIEPVRYR